MSAFESFTIDKKSDIPIWVQIRQRMAFLIVSGKCQPGDQLPTVRELAIKLDVNYHTVNKVYRDLESSGLVEVRVGRGTYVANLDRSNFIVLEGDTHAAVAEHATKLLELGMSPEEAVQAMADYLNVTVEIVSAQAADAEAKQRERRAG